MPLLPKTPNDWIRTTAVCFSICIALTIAAAFSPGSSSFSFAFYATMRASILLFWLLACGCRSRVTQQEITDSTGSNRLARVDRKNWCVEDMIANRQSYDFDSLVWRTNSGGVWHDRVIVSEAAFQAASPRRRWVSQLHSLDAAKGTAIITVAEGDVPEGSPSVDIFILGASGACSPTARFA
jgi:hypothetical protein